MFTYCVSWPRLNKTGVVVASTNEVSTLNWSEQVHIAIISLASKEYVCSLHNMWKNGNIHSLLNSLSSVRVFFFKFHSLDLDFSKNVMEPILRLLCIFVEVESFCLLLVLIASSCVTSPWGNQNAHIVQVFLDCLLYCWSKVLLLLY